MRLLVLIGLCCAVGFLGGSAYQKSILGSPGAESDAASSAGASVTTDMALFLSTSGILCEAVQDRPRDEEIAQIGNRSKERNQNSKENLERALNSAPEQKEEIQAVIDQYNMSLRQRMTQLISARVDGETLTRLEAIDFVMGNLSVIREAEVNFRSLLNEQQLQNLGDEGVNPFLYLEEDVVQLFQSLTFHPKLLVVLNVTGN